MKALTLQEIAAAVEGKLSANADGKSVICHVTIDTREIRQGSLFVAIKGERFNGHDFIVKAFELGAAAVISSRASAAVSNAPVILVEDTRIAFGMLASYYRSLFSLFVIGVTGSVGKTSTKELIATVVEKKYRVLKNAGNLNNDIGLPKTLFALEEEHQAAVLEMGMSHLGEIQYLSQLAKPDLAVITNVGVSHLENLGSRDHILKAKLEILDGMSSDSRVILNADNDKLWSVREQLGERARYFGIENTSVELFAKEIHQIGDSMEFTICYQKQCYPARLPVIGIHNVYNALAGFLVGMQIGLSPEAVTASFLEYENSGMRQRVCEYDGIKVIEDCYNASPDSMQAAVDVISSIACSGKRIAVFGDMLELGSDSARMHWEVGEIAAASAVDLLYCYGPESVYMQEGARQNRSCQALHFLDLQKMVLSIRENLQKGDAIIFKASRGMQLEQAIGELFLKR